MVELEVEQDVLGCQFEPSRELLALSQQRACGVVWGALHSGGDLQVVNKFFGELATLVIASISISLSTLISLLCRFVVGPSRVRAQLAC